MGKKESRYYEEDSMFCSRGGVHRRGWRRGLSPDGSLDCETFSDFLVFDDLGRMLVRYLCNVPQLGFV